MTTVLRPGQDFAIRGRLRLTGVSADVAAHASVALFAGSALGSRTALHEARDATDGRVSGNQVGEPVPVTSGEFAFTGAGGRSPLARGWGVSAHARRVCAAAIGRESSRHFDDVPALLPRPGTATGRLHARPTGDGSACRSGAERPGRFAHRARGGPRWPAGPAARIRGLTGRAIERRRAHSCRRPVAHGQPAHDERRFVA